MKKVTASSYKFGPYYVDVVEQLLLRDGAPVRLTQKAFETLLVLVERVGHLVEKDELLRTVWPDTFVEEANLSQNIFKLRKALGTRPGGLQYIETVPKRGYRFIARVTEMPMESGPSAPATRDSSKSTRHKAQARGEDIINSLAVLPLFNVSDDVNLEYLSDGITESIINSLSKLPQLKVFARSTMFRFKGTDLDPFEVGRQLNAHALLIGRILQIDEELIIKLELINVQEGSQIWGEQFKRNSADIFEVQEEISQEVSEKLKLRLTHEQKRQLTKRYTEDIEAYHLYLKGRYCWNKRTGEALKMAIEFFQEAIAKDPDYTLAYTGLADSYAIISFYSNMPPKPAFEEAKKATDKALEIDETLAEAHASLAFVKEYYEWDWIGADKEYKQAIELNPNYATVHQWYGMYFMKLGQYERARRELERALRLDPRSLIINADLGLPFYFKRQYDEAVGQYRKVLEIDRDFIWARYFLGWAYERSGKFSEAVAEFEKAKLIDERPEVSAMIAHTYALSGKKSRAVSILNNLQEQSKHLYISPYYIALIHAGLDDKEQAFAWLEKAYSDRNEWLVWLKVDPRFDCLWTDARFPQLLRRIGFTQGESEGNAQDSVAMSLSNRAGTDPETFVARAINCVTLIESGRFDEAIAELKEARAIIDSAEASAFLGYAFAVSGRRDEAHALLKELHEAPIMRDIDPALMTVIYAGLEENDQAFEYLQKAYESRSVWLTLISKSPLFASLRADPRFTKLSRLFGRADAASSALP